MKKLEKIAQQIIKIEKQYQLNNNNNSNYEKEIFNLIQGLSIEELLFIDEYILENKMLKN